MNYVKKFYQKAGENNRMAEQENEDQDGMDFEDEPSNNSRFDDLPKSVTEESSMFENDPRNKNRGS